MKKLVGIVAACFAGVALMPVALMVVFVAPAVATLPVTCQITGQVSSLTAAQSKVVTTIAGRAELAGLGDNGVRIAVQASLALTGLTNEPNTGSGVGIFAFDPNGNWGPVDALSSEKEDALLFMGVLDENPTWETESPSQAASAVMNAEGVVKPATPAVFAAYAKQAATITTDVETLASGQGGCGSADPATVSSVGSGALPAGYKVPSATSAQRQQAVAAAISQIGNNYVWGDADPATGFDCSGLTMWAWAQATPPIALDHYTVSQWDETTSLPSLVGAQPGDIVLVPGSDGTLNPPNPQHVGMYIGDIHGVPYVVDAADTQLGVIAQTYSSFISDGLIAIGHITTTNGGS